LCVDLALFGRRLRRGDALLMCGHGPIVGARPC
jgi:hypothetical protein